MRPESRQRHFTPLNPSTYYVGSFLVIFHYIDTSNIYNSDTFEPPSPSILRQIVTFRQVENLVVTIPLL